MGLPVYANRAFLVNALAERAQFLRLRHGLAVRTELGPEPSLGSTCKEALYGIAREALHNAAKHATPNEVTLKLFETGQGLVLEINDDGIGFDSQTDPPAGHFGLAGIRERTRLIGGELVIKSSLGFGTQILLQIRNRPYAKEA